MHIIDSSRIQEALKNKGYSSISDLARSLGIHRNTIHHYLSGHGVFPESIEKIMNALDLNPHDILIEKDVGHLFSLTPIASLVDQLHMEYPNVTFVLFGSRPRGTAHKYSDWDIGVFSKDGLPHEIYRKIVRRKSELIQDLPFLVDLVNLNRADDYFLRDISKHWMFLAGKLSDWMNIKRRAIS